MSQTDQIKKHLNDGLSITAFEALSRYGCFRLAARIKDLREYCMNIMTEMVEINGKKVARYRKLALHFGKKAV